MSEKQDWEKALARVKRLLEQSHEIAMTCPNAYMGIYDMGLQNLRRRYEQGERSVELYEEMMNYAE